MREKGQETCSAQMTEVFEVAVQGDAEAMAESVCTT